MTAVMNWFRELGEALWFLKDVIGQMLKGRVRFGEVLKQTYEQGIQSILIIALTSLATGVVLALQSYIMMVRFGAKEYIAQVVAWSLVKEMGPVFTAIIFSAKAGARITAELGSMNVNDQMLATRTLGVDPIEFLVLPRILACFLVLPILTLISDLIGMGGGLIVGVFEAHIPPAYYINQTLQAIRYIDFFSGLAKIFFFSIIIGWTCCYNGFITRGGSLGVGKYTTRAVAGSIIFILIANTVLTKIILTLWE